jgi:isocitrate/isopropylmalate dehydrogenase
VTGRQTYIVACLSGNGIGPEVMMEASRALAQVSRLHGFRVQEVHPPVGSQAVTQFGRAFPATSRHATLAADAVLVARGSDSEPALQSVKAELDLAASVSRTLLPEGDLTVFAPLAEGADTWTIDRGLASAKARTGRLVAVGTGEAWYERVAERAEQDGTVAVRRVTLAEALHALTTAPASLGVVLTERVLADALADVPRVGGAHRPLRASGLLSPLGPGLFGPTHGSAVDIAGQGVANPSEMLLATALLLGEGLGRRAAAETLEESLAAALRREVQTPDMIGTGVAATTREFVDVVLGLLPGARRDTEFALGGAP